MNGANASTVVATISNSPVRQRKIASGTSHRRCESLRHRPRPSSAIDPNVLPNTISPRWILPRFLSTHFLLPSRRCALRYSGLARHQYIDPRAEKRRITFRNAIDDWFSSQIERGIQQDGDACALTVRLQQRIKTRRHRALQRLQSRRAIYVRDSL